METVIKIRVDREHKETAVEVFKNLGMSLRTGIGVYLAQVALRGGIPFSIQLPSQSQFDEFEDADIRPRAPESLERERRNAEVIKRMMSGKPV